MDNWRNLLGLESNARAIREGARSILDEVKAMLEAPDLSGLGTRLIIQDDERVPALLSTPISEARIRMDWRRTSELRIVGVLVLEQKRYDNQDQPFWTQAFEVLVPPYGRPYMEKDGNEIPWALGGSEARSSNDEIFILGAYLSYHATRHV